VRADPTAAVAPERVRQTLRRRPPPGLVAGTLGRFDPDLAERLARLRQLWSAADHRWNQWVLDHDRQRQLDLLRRLGWAELDSIDLARVLLLGLATLGLAGAGWAAWDGRRRLLRPRRDAWLAGWLALRERLQRAGLDLPAQATPRAAARAAQARWGEGAQALVQALDALEALRYAAPPVDPPGAAAPAGLRPLLRQARRALARLPAAPRAPSAPSASTAPTGDGPVDQPPAGGLLFSGSRPD
jgi:hypothetical protein